MIIATTMKDTRYRCEGIPLRHYFNDEAYWALYALTSPIMFRYESEHCPADFNPMILMRDENLGKTLECKIGGFTVRELLKVRNPMGTFRHFDAHHADVAKLPMLVGYGAPAGALIVFLQIMMGRATVWGLHYNKRVAKIDSVFKVVPVTITQPMIEWTNNFIGVIDGEVLKG